MEGATPLHEMALFGELSRFAVVLLMGSYENMGIGADMVLADGRLVGTGVLQILCPGWTAEPAKLSTSAFTPGATSARKQPTPTRTTSQTIQPELSAIVASQSWYVDDLTGRELSGANLLESALKEHILPWSGTFSPSFGSSTASPPTLKVSQWALPFGTAAIPGY